MLIHLENIKPQHTDGNKSHDVESMSLFGRVVTNSIKNDNEKL
jgi:hypothetical protein